MPCLGMRVGDDLVTLLVRLTGRFGDCLDVIFPFANATRDRHLERNRQLFPIACKGKMSLIGPRAVPVEDRQRYRSWLPTLATVRPGVSGAWAVVPVASVEEEMRASVYYIRNWTIWLDIQILIQTVLVILRGRWERLSD